MKRFLLFITLVFLFASCGKDKTTVESEFRVELTYVGASRARITVAAMNMKAYYSYIQLSPQEEYYSSSAKEAIKAEVAFLEDAITYFENSNFTDAFCYRGSRQFTFSGIGIGVASIPRIIKSFLCGGFIILKSHLSKLMKSHLNRKVNN